MRTNLDATLVDTNDNGLVGLAHNDAGVTALEQWWKPSQCTTQRNKALIASRQAVTRDAEATVDPQPWQASVGGLRTHHNTHLAANEGAGVGVDANEHVLHATSADTARVPVGGRWRGEQRGDE